MGLKMSTTILSNISKKKKNTNQINAENTSIINSKI